ncbi:MAG TPA: hypothetical protein VET26_09540 [Candidatus Sulfotelmatobacter sp.]|nr:hypothetical protein [Candidatus Sulfotelmatobacter sp.]
MLDVAADRLLHWRWHPEAMVRELFHVEPDPWQLEVLEDFPHCPKQAMAACKGPGKTATEAWLGWNFLLTRKHPKVGAVSVTGVNLDDNLWPEMAKWQKVAPILDQQFQWTTESVYLRAHPETWFMTRKAWKQSATPEELGETLAGLWADHVLFLFDEAGPIPVPILRTAEAALQRYGTEGHIVMGGNCNSIEGCLYYAVVTRRGEWRCYEVTGDPDDPKRSPRIDVEYARKQIAEHGRDDPWVMINLLAKFPKQGINQLIGADQVRECLGRHLHPSAYEWAPKVLGGDIADMGDDRTVLFPRQGPAYFSPIVLRKMDSVQIAGHAMAKANTWGADSIQIDATGGYGVGPIAIMRDQGFQVLAVQFAGDALNPRYYRKRDEIWWLLAEHIKQGASLPADCPEIVAELSTPTYSYKGDKIIVEPKDSIKARLGRSPDLAEAAACTHAFPVATTRSTREALFPFDISQGVTKSKTDYDPLERA